MLEQLVHTSIPTDHASSFGLILFQPVQEDSLSIALELVWINDQALAYYQDPTIKPGYRLRGEQQDDMLLSRIISDLHQHKNYQSIECQIRPHQWLMVQLLPVNGSFQVILHDITEKRQALYKQTRSQARVAIVASIATKLSEAPCESMDSCLEEALEQIGLYVGADRTTIILYSPDQQTGICKHEWLRFPQKSFKGKKRLDAKNAPWWHRQMLAGNVIQLLSLDELPPEASIEREILRAHNTCSLLCIPLVLNGRTRGFISLHAIGKTQTWDEDDITVLKALAQALVSNHHHRQNEEALQRTYRRLEGLRTIEGAMLRHLNHEQPELAALRHLRDLVPCQRLSIISIDQATGMAHVEGRLHEGVLESRPGLYLEAFHFQIPELLRGEPVTIEEIQPESPEIPPELQFFEQGFRSMLVLPFLREQQLSGCLVLMATTPHFFTHEHIEIAAEVASQLSLVFHQRQLSEQLRHYTEELEARVEERARTLASLMGMQKAILEHAGIAILSTDQAGVIQSVNPALEKLLGYSTQELLGRMRPNQLLHPNQAQEQDRHLSALLGTDRLTGEQLVLEYIRQHCTLQQKTTLVHKEGHLLSVLCTASSLYDEEGRLTGYVKIITDISALVRAEEDLQVANQRLKLATQAAQLGIWECDLHTNQIVWDERMHQIHGTSPLTFKGTSEELLSMIHPDYLTEFSRRYDILTSLDDQFGDELCMIRPDGSSIFTESVGLLVRDKNGTATKVLGVVRDITERKQAELALQQSEQKFREFAEQVDHIFWIHSASTFELLFINSAYERISGLPAGALANNPFAFFTAVIEEYRDRVEKATQAYFAGQTIDVEFCYQSPQGEMRWMHARSFISRNEQGEAVRYMGIGRDITDQKTVEIRLRSSLEQEKKLNQLKSQFVSTASHEFRTPLATIQSSVDLIKIYLEPLKEVMHKAVNRHLGIIGGEIEKFATLLSDILTLGRIEAGKVELAPTETDVLELCNEVLSTHFSGRADNRRVVMQQAGLPRTLLLDKKLMRHVLVNLLSNCFKFSTGFPLLQVTFEPAAVLIAITDDGIGIPAEDLPHLFERFFRASNTGTIPGTGLGLVITRQFIELHGGTLEVESEVGRGTTFTIRLTGS